MTWEYFVEQFSNWKKEVIIHNIEELDKVGTAEEMAEVICALKEEELAEALLIKGLKEAITFSPTDIIKIKEILGAKKTNYLVKKSDLDGVIFTKEEIFELLSYIDDDVCTHIVLKSNSLYLEEEMEILEDRINGSALELLKHRKRIFEELCRIYPNIELKDIKFDEINLLDSEEKKLSTNLGLAELKENVRILEETFERVMKEREEGNFWKSFITAR